MPPEFNPNPADWGLALTIMLIILTALITNKGLVTSARLKDWMEAEKRERERADRADAELWENTRQLERLADILKLRDDLRSEQERHRHD